MGDRVIINFEGLDKSLYIRNIGSYGIDLIIDSRPFMKFKDPKYSMNELYKYTQLFSYDSVNKIEPKIEIKEENSRGDNGFILYNCETGFVQQFNPGSNDYQYGKRKFYIGIPPNKPQLLNKSYIKSHWIRNHGNINGRLLYSTMIPLTNEILSKTHV